VDEHNVQALYSLAHRANSLTPGFEITIDLTAAGTQPEVLGELLAYAEAQSLPASADSRGTGCKLRILANGVATHAAADWALAV
jgi:hypothetical protein